MKTQPRKLQQPVSLIGPASRHDQVYLSQLLLKGRQHDPVLLAFTFWAFQTAAPLFLLILLLIPINLVAQETRQVQKSVVQVLSFEDAPRNDAPSSSLNPIAHGFGVVIGPNGLILTNRHLIADHNTSHVRILFPETNELLPAELIAGDAWVDLAVLKVDRTGLPYLNLAKSNSPTPFGERLEIRPGTTSGIAEKFPLLKLDQGKSRFDSLARDSLYQYGGLIRIPTTQSGFKSGAAVLNANGELVGITTALVPEHSSGPDVTVIPLTSTYASIAQRMSTGHLFEYAFLGVTPRDLSEVQRKNVESGVQVVDVVTNSPGDVAGLVFSDVITHINDQPIADVNEFQALLGRLPGRSKIRIGLTRGALSNAEREQLELECFLGTRSIVTRRGSWQSAPLKGWQGMRVQHPFAMPKYQTLLASIVHRGCVVVQDVQVDSTAWKSGLRPRFVILKVNGEVAESTDFFYEAVNKAGLRAVEITVSDPDTGQEVNYTVNPE